MSQPYTFALPKWASRLNCVNSGNCCIGQLRKWSDDDGVCGKFDKATRKCTIYEERPDACRHFPFFGYPFDGVIEITAYLNCFGCFEEGAPNVDLSNIAVLGRDVWSEMRLMHAGKELSGESKRAYWNELKNKIKTQTLLHLSSTGKPTYFAQGLYEHLYNKIIGNPIQAPSFAQDFISFRAALPQYVYTKECVYLLRAVPEGISWKEIFTSKQGVIEQVKTVTAESEAAAEFGKYVDYLFENNFAAFLAHHFFKAMTGKAWREAIVQSSALDRVAVDAFNAILANANLVAILLANIEDGPITAWRMRAACGYADGNGKMAIVHSGRND